MEPDMSEVAAALQSYAKPIAAADRVATGRISVEIRRDLDLRPEDDVALTGLIASRPDVGVFVSRAWLSGLFAEPPSGVEPQLVLFREGAVLRAVAPIAVRRRRAHVVVGLLGGGVRSDRVDMLAARGFEAVCADAFLAWIGDAFGRGYIIELRDVPADSPLWGALLRAKAGRTPLVCEPLETHVLPYLGLAESRGYSPKALDKDRCKLQRRGKVRIELLQDPSDAISAFDSLSEFLHARWRDHGGSAFEHPSVDRFHRHVIPLLLRDGYLRMIRVSIDMRPIAVFYGLSVAKWWGYYMPGFDREWAGRIHLGQINTAAAIDLAEREGAEEFDFLKGVEPVKYLWPVRERSAWDVDVYSAHSTSQLSRALRAARDSAAAVVKSARGLPSMVTGR